MKPKVGSVVVFKHQLLLGELGLIIDKGFIIQFDNQIATDCEEVSFEVIDYDADLLLDPTRRYKQGDMVGICSDCMCDCRIVAQLSNKQYIIEPVKIYHSNSKQSVFSSQKYFIVKENQIVVKLSKEKK